MKITRREAMFGGAAGLALAACQEKPELASDAAAIELGELDGVATGELVSKGELSAVDVVEAAIRRARAVEPEINAIVNETFELALEQAKKPVSGPFMGVPTFVKDLTDVTGQPTEYGSRGFKGYIAQAQAPFTDAYFKTGLISLGKSSTPESGAISTTEPLSSGPTRNPWNTAYSTGGSSGGAAALTAAGVVPFAYASDGGGSIRIPASACGLFGLKPSRGRTLPTRLQPPPEVDISVALSVSRTVRDSATLLCEVERTGSDAVYEPVGLVSEASSRRLRIGLMLEPLTGTPLDPEVRAALENVAELCESLGHTVMPVSFPIDAQPFSDAFLLYWAAGSAQFAQQASEFSGKPIGPEILEPWSLGLAQYYEANKDGMEDAIRILKEIEPVYDAFISGNQLDLILTPVLGTKPTEIGYQAPTVEFEVLRQRVLEIAPYTPLQNAAGAAAMSVPLSWSTDGLPIGSHFAGRKGDEKKLLELAFELEEARPWIGRKPPLYAS